MNTPVINETFAYDSFNRLVTSMTNDDEYEITYDKYGRILSKEMPEMTFVGAIYHNDKPHALKKYTTYTEPPFSNQSVTYTDFDKVESVSMNGNTLQFIYGHDHHRRYMTETVDSVTRSKTYIGNCEFVQSATEGNHALTYLYGPSGIFAVVKKVGNNETIRYVHTDHLGSWNVITDRYGRLVQEYGFDAWGNLRNANGSTANLIEPIYDRGFTGHEHHYDFGLINMNGRMYDPYTSMFLSPDNYIQAPDNSQSFNRYAYCLNNPLRFTDPSGYVVRGRHDVLNRSFLTYYDFISLNSDGSSFNTDLSAGKQLPKDDWYEDSDGNIKWTDCKSQAEMDMDGIDGKYLGEIVALFQGSIIESLGKNDILDGEGGNPANVTVYGKLGPNDVENYIGFTMSSDYEKYGAIANGYYDVTYDKLGKSGIIPSNYAVNNRNPVDCLFDINNGWYNDVPNSYSPTQKNGIFVHRTNMNGFAGSNVSVGCPLILGVQWQQFEKQIGKNGFKMIIRREIYTEPKCIMK